jgi:hypothetical protein
MGHLLRQGLRAREPRKKVLIKARMQAGSRWADVCLLNMSSRGILIHSFSAPPENSYIEVRRGRHVIVGRVVWSKDHRFGVCTQDPLPIEALITGQDNDEGAAPASSALGERRAVPRKPAPINKHEQSRLLGRSIEFCSITAASIGLALVGVGMVEAAVSEPLSVVTAALD